MKQVFFDHDAHVDDLLVLMMLQCADVDLIGTAVCPGDCYKEPGLRATRRFLDFFGNKNIPSAAGDDEGTHPFPELWRADSEILANLPELGESQAKSPGRAGSAAELIVSALSRAAAPVSLVITGPPTNLAAALAASPSIKEKIERVWIMGGAVRVNGNVDKGDGTAEWNFYNHPRASASVIDSGIPITLVSLDATNKAPVTRKFLERLAEQAKTHDVSRLALATWKVALRHIENEDYTQRYYFWDTLTTAAMLRPSLMKTQRMKVKVVVEGPSSGRTIEDPSGAPIDVGVDVECAELEDMILDLFKGDRA